MGSKSRSSSNQQTSNSSLTTVDNSVDNSYTDNSTNDHSFVDSSTTDNSFLDASQTDNSYSDSSVSVDSSDNSYNDSSTTDNSFLDLSDNSYNDSSTTDNSFIDASTTDNSYIDASQHDNSVVDASDNSYNDSSQYYADNSYKDDSINGTYAGNNGSITITDGGAFTTVQNAVSDLTSLGKEAFTSTQLTVAELGKTANVAIDRAYLQNQLMRDVTTSALEDVTNVAGTVTSASLAANAKALEETQKVMTTIAADGNDLLIDGVVDIAKYIGMGLGGIAATWAVVSVLRKKAA